jgi:hypothetical protein
MVCALLLIAMFVAVLADYTNRIYVCLCLQDNPSLYALWPNGTCASLGLDGAYNSSLTTMLEAMVNASNPAAVAATINQRLAGLMSGAAGNGSTGVALADRVRGSWLALCVSVCCLV